MVEWSGHGSGEPGDRHISGGQICGGRRLRAGKGCRGRAVPDRCAQTFLGGASASVGRVPNGTVRACVDTETGFLLEYTNTGSANDQLIATSVRKATDKDFEPPAPVQGY